MISLPIPDAHLRHTTDDELRKIAKRKDITQKLRNRLVKELAVRRILRSHGKRVIVAPEPYLD